MERKWHCPQFQSHATNIKRKLAFGSCLFDEAVERLSVGRSRVLLVDSAVE
jgi:hypothetical protein